jgi:hypothetical protein
MGATEIIFDRGNSPSAVKIARLSFIRLLDVRGILFSKRVYNGQSYGQSLF